MSIDTGVKVSSRGSNWWRGPTIQTFLSAQSAGTIARKRSRISRRAHPESSVTQPTRSKLPMCANVVTSALSHQHGSVRPVGQPTRYIRASNHILQPRMCSPCHPNHWHYSITTPYSLSSAPHTLSHSALRQVAELDDKLGSEWNFLPQPPNMRFGKETSSRCTCMCLARIALVLSSQ